MTSAAVVAAVQAYAKINSLGQWVEPIARVSQNDLFERMTREELYAYPKYGTLPPWFQKAVGATDSVSQRPKAMKNQKDKLYLTATDSTLGPGDFPLRSIESRAAARRRVELSLNASLTRIVRAA